MEAANKELGILNKSVTAACESAVSALGVTRVIFAVLLRSQCPRSETPSLMLSNNVVIFYTGSAWAGLPILIAVPSTVWLYLVLCVFEFSYWAAWNAT